MTTFHLERIPPRPLLILLNYQFPLSSAASVSAYLPRELLPVGLPTRRTKQQEKRKLPPRRPTSWNFMGRKSKRDYGGSS